MKMKWLIKTAVAAGIMYASSGTAYAQCGGNGTQGTYNSTFWTWYTDNNSTNRGYGGNDCLNITNVREAEAYWYLDDGASDAVGGIGYAAGKSTGTFTFNVFPNSASSTNENDGLGSKAYGMMYGWSCVNGNPQEYYVVENSGGGQFTPYDNSRNAVAAQVGNSYTSNGGTYKVYITFQKGQPHACGAGGKDFTQYWSVRQGDRWAGDISIANHVTAWTQDNRGFAKAGMGNGYQVYGVEGVINSTGKAKWSVNRK
jgi:hypothetical protein